MSEFTASIEIKTTDYGKTFDTAEVGAFLRLLRHLEDDPHFTETEGKKRKPKPEPPDPIRGRENARLREAANAEAKPDKHVPTTTD